MLERISQIYNKNQEAIISFCLDMFFAIVIIYLSLILAKFVRHSVSKTCQKSRDIDEMIAPLLAALAAYVVYFIAVVIVLDLFGINTTSFIALLGAAGLAVGFALKDTLSNIAAGVMLMFLRPFKINDFIECGGISGSIKEVGLFTTILETADGLYISAPNSSLWGKPIKNFTRNGKRRVDFTVGISYSDSIETGLAVLQSIADSESTFLQQPSTQVIVHTMADSSVNLQLRAWCNVDDYWDVYWRLTKQIKVDIESAGLTIPFPQRVITMTP